MSDDKQNADEDTNYNVGKKVTVTDIMSMDKEDESLRKYKEALLGQATKEVWAPKDDPRKVVLVELRIQFEERPNNDVVYKLETKGDVDKMKDTPFSIKEGCNYKIVLTFRCQHELITGLKYVSAVSRAGIPLGKDSTMIGSFAPKKEPYTMAFPKHGWEEAPKGMLARGKYKSKCQFVDDDKNVHLEFEYAFSIKKDWDAKDDE